MDTIKKVNDLGNEVDQASKSNIADKGYFRYQQYELIDMLFVAIGRLQDKIEKLEASHADDGK